jgi:hypothetical protein
MSGPRSALGGDAGKRTVADGPGAAIRKTPDQSYPGKPTNLRWHHRPLLDPGDAKNAPLRVEKRLRPVVPMGRNRVGPLPRNRVVPFRRNQVGPITRNPAADRLPLLDRLYTAFDFSAGLRVTAINPLNLCN